jgi:hypothetical protein
LIAANAVGGAGHVELIVIERLCGSRNQKDGLAGVS